MSFWDVHGIFFLLFMLFFPRLTLLLATSASFGFFAWIGWLIAPRFLGALLATIYYWHTNPALCVLTWVAAFCAAGGGGVGVSVVVRR